jgi:dTMP kinase
MNKPGLFISFEGGEGAGKTTQINHLAKTLSRKGRKVLTTREPGGTPEGEKIRNLIVQREGGGWTPMAECLLLFAARAMHVEKIIGPALLEDVTVLSDRFTDSTRAYQGYGRGLPDDMIESLNRLALGDFTPDLTFVMDIDPALGLERSGRRLAAESLHLDQAEDRFENLGLDFHRKIREGFLDIARKSPGRCHIIDAGRELEEITAEIEKIVMEKLD